MLEYPLQLWNFDFDLFTNVSFFYFFLFLKKFLGDPRESS